MFTKKRILLIALVISLLALTAAGTMAYFTAEETARNVITTGKLDIELVELGADGRPFPKEGITGVMPGDQVVKKVTVKNAGTADAYVRVSVEKSITPQLDTDVIQPQFNTADWTEKDGWYYYKRVLPAWQETAPLFETVVFDAVGMDNPYMNATVFIDVDTQAVQSRNNGESALTAQGWPEDVSEDME